MGRQMRLFILLGVIVISGVSGTTWAAEPKNYLQTNISAAKISVRDAVYTVDVQILASDFEEMFQKHPPTQQPPAKAGGLSFTD